MYNTKKEYSVILVVSLTEARDLIFPYNLIAYVKSGELGNLSMHTWGTPGAHLGHNLGHTWGTSRAHLGQKAHLGHTSGTTTWGTPRAHLGHISGTSRADYRVT